MEFITGLFLGGLAVFLTLEYYHIRNRFIHSDSHTSNTEENTRWRNLMAYDGSERGQQNIEN